MQVASSAESRSTCENALNRCRQQRKRRRGKKHGGGFKVFAYVLEPEIWRELRLLFILTPIGKWLFQIRLVLFSLLLDIFRNSRQMTDQQQN